MSDIFRKDYRMLTDLEKSFMSTIKTKANELYAAFEEAGKPGSREQGMGAREMALAKTKLEEAVMWAIKSITG